MPYRQLALAGIFFAGDLSVWHWSILFTSVANSTLLANFAPIFVAFAAMYAGGLLILAALILRYLPVRGIEPKNAAR